MSEEDEMNLKSKPGTLLAELRHQSRLKKWGSTLMSFLSAEQ